MLMKNNNPAAGEKSPFFMTLYICNPILVKIDITHYNLAFHIV